MLAILKLVNSAQSKLVNWIHKLTRQNPPVGDV